MQIQILNLEKASTTNVAEHILSGFSISMSSSFKTIKASILYTKVKIV